MTYFGMQDRFLDGDNTPDQKDKCAEPGKFTQKVPPAKFEYFRDFVDRRGRAWEWFIDSSHFDCTCVRVKGETDFSSPLSFHFNTSAVAKKFVELLKQAS